MAKFNLIHNPGPDMPDCEYILEILRESDGVFIGSMYMKDEAQAALVQARINGTKLPGKAGKLAALQRGFALMAKGFKKSQEVARQIDKSYNFDAALGKGSASKIGMPQSTAQQRRNATQSAQEGPAPVSDTFDTGMVSGGKVDSRMVSPRAQGAGAPRASSDSVFGVTPRFDIDSSFTPRFKFESGVPMGKKPSKSKPEEPDVYK